MRLDPHGCDGKYLIRSVYFDNFDNKILRQKTEGFYHRDKFRARLYDHNANFINLEKRVSGITLPINRSACFLPRNTNGFVQGI